MSGHDIFVHTASERGGRLVLLAMLFALFASCEKPAGRTPAATAQPTPTIEELQSEPLKIVASNFGDFAKGASWDLTVNSAGQAEFSISGFRPSAQRQFTVSVEQLDEFRQAVIDDEFFSLAGDYGDIVACGSTQTITVVACGKTQTVKIHYLTNSGPAEVQEASRALRLLHMVRGWIDDPAAVDLRPADNWVFSPSRRLGAGPIPRPLGRSDVCRRR